MGRVSTMEAGRELDALVAEKVMGWVNVRSLVAARSGTADWYGRSPVWAPGGDNTAVPRYSSDIAAAWEVVERLRAEGWEFEIWDRDEHLTKVHDAPWGAEFSRERPGIWEPLRRKGSADGAPLAICRAALSAMREP